MTEVTTDFIRYGIFNFQIKLVKDRTEWNKLMDMWDYSAPFPMECGGFCQAFEHDNGMTTALIYLPEILKKYPMVLVKNTTHECTHAFQNLCHKIGENEPSMEFQAYYIGDMTEAILAQYLNLHCNGRITIKT